MNYYEMLGLTTDSSQEQIQPAIDKKRRELMAKFRSPNPVEAKKAQTQLAELQERVVSIMLDPNLRAEYDRSLTNGYGKTASGSVNLMGHTERGKGVDRRGHTPFTAKDPAVDYAALGQGAPSGEAYTVRELVPLLDNNWVRARQAFISGELAHWLRYSAELRDLSDMVVKEASQAAGMTEIDQDTRLELLFHRLLPEYPVPDLKVSNGHIDLGALEEHRLKVRKASVTVTNAGRPGDMRVGFVRLAVQYRYKHAGFSLDNFGTTYFNQDIVLWPGQSITIPIYARTSYRQSIQTGTNTKYQNVTVFRKNNDVNMQLDLKVISQPVDTTYTVLTSFKVVERKPAFSDYAAGALVGILAAIIAFSGIYPATASRNYYGNNFYDYNLSYNPVLSVLGAFLIGCLLGTLVYLFRWKRITI